MKHGWIGLAIAVAACSAGGTDTSGAVDTGAAGGTGGSSGVPTTKLASDIAIAQISLFQTVEVPLMRNGMEIDDRPVPVVAGKDAVLRVFFQLGPSWQPRPVTVALVVENDQGITPIPPITGTPGGTSTEDAYSSTANFAIPGAALTANARFAVSIHEASALVNVAGDTSGAQWPAQGSQAFLEQVTNMGTKVVLVPIRYDADGSGRVPDTSDATVETLRARMRALYPTPDVSIRVADVLPYANVVSPTNGSDWQTLLQALLAYRQSSGAAPDEYYYGLILPAASEADFCSGGCIAGLTSSVVGGPSQPEVRGSVGVAFVGEAEASTFVHEVGHAHTLRHAPCSEVGPIQAVDPNFPYAHGQIGVWGLDVANGVLEAPNVAKDMMGYCHPTWISDYHYVHLAKEMQYVSGAARAVFPEGFPAKWQVVAVDANGRGTLGITLDVESFPSGEKRAAPVVVNGVEKILTGYYHPFDHIDGGFLFVPMKDGVFAEDPR